MTDVHMRLDKVPILRGADLTLRPGTVTCLAGGNGAGKTTLLRVAAGIFRPHAGTVRGGEIDPARDRAGWSRHIGFVTAGNDGIYARLTLRENLELWAAIAYLPPAERGTAIEAAICAFDLEHLADRRSDRLSLGQRQRIRLAMGSLHQPKVLMLDEPHSSLDDEGLGVLAGAMDALRRRGGAVVWAAPSPEHAPGLPRDEVVVIHDGRTAAA